MRRPASKKAQLFSCATQASCSAKPAHFTSPPANLSAMAPAGVPIGGGATSRTGGTGMPGSIGALRMACTSAALPCAACQAVCGCMDWKSLLPSMRITSASGLFTSMRWASPSSPLRPGLKGSSKTVRRPLRQSSIRRTSSPCALRPFSSRPGQRTSNGWRARVPGTMPQDSESAYTRICFMDRLPILQSPPQPPPQLLPQPASPSLPLLHPPPQPMWLAQYTPLPAAPALRQSSW